MRWELTMNIQMFKRLLCLGFLYLLARQDYRRKKMDAVLLYAFLVIGIICMVLESLVGSSEMKSGFVEAGSCMKNVESNFIRLLPGVLFLLAGASTGEAVGYGDGLAVLAMGCYVDAYSLWKSLGISLFLAAGCSVFILLFHEKREQIEIPYIPYLLTGMVVMLGVS